MIHPENHDEIEAAREEARAAMTDNFLNRLRYYSSHLDKWIRPMLGVSVILLAISLMRVSSNLNELYMAYMRSEGMNVQILDQLAENVSSTHQRIARLEVAAMQLAAVQDAMQAPADAPVVEVSMFTSRPEETDDTPCIAASGKDICKLKAIGENICASNDVPFGTMLRFFGLGTCTVWDRMNERYTGTGRVDWYAGDGAEALELARQHGVRKYRVVPINLNQQQANQAPAATSTKR